MDDKSVLLDFFNNILDVNVTTNDIDICHEIPSRQMDEKRVIVCKFISRKTKIDILNAKKYFGNMLSETLIPRTSDRYRLMKKHSPGKHLS